MSRSGSTQRGPNAPPAREGGRKTNACCVRLKVRAHSHGKASLMNTTPTMNPSKKMDDKKETCGTAADKSDACATTTAKPEACSNTTTKPEACSTTTAKPETCATTTEKSAACANTHDGKVVSISGSTLVMSGCDGQEHSHTVAADAKVCCDGAACQTEDLKVGSKIRVTTQTDDKNVATKIESLDKQAKFAQSI